MFWNLPTCPTRLALQLKAASLIGSRRQTAMGIDARRECPACLGAAFGYVRRQDNFSSPHGNSTFDL